MPGDVFLILAEFGRQSEQAALDLLIPTVERVFPGAALHTIVVDGAATAAADHEIAPHIQYIQADNSLGEFSGWDRGIDRVERRFALRSDSVFVLANDTVVRADKRSRVRDVPSDRAASAASGALVGWVDEYPRSVELFGWTLRQWVDTSFVISNRNTLESLRPLGRAMPDSDVFADDWRAFFRHPSPLSVNYREYLSTYFFGEQPSAEFPHSWYAQQPLTAANADAFKAKLRCVFCEHLLGARARSARIPLVDIRETPLPVDPF
ncbi:MAG TPA: hypothetical protein VGJ29_10400 [Vicinamibacterales bacterium]